MAGALGLPGWAGARDPLGVLRFRPNPSPSPAAPPGTQAGSAPRTPHHLAPPPGPSSPGPASRDPPHRAASPDTSPHSSILAGGRPALPSPVCTAPSPAPDPGPGPRLCRPRAPRMGNRPSPVTPSRAGAGSGSCFWGGGSSEASLAARRQLEADGAWSPEWVLLPRCPPGPTRRRVEGGKPLEGCSTCAVWAVPCPRGCASDMKAAPRPPQGHRAPRWMEMQGAAQHTPRPHLLWSWPPPPRPVHAHTCTHTRICAHTGSHTHCAHAHSRAHTLEHVQCPLTRTHTAHPQQCMALSYAHTHMCTHSCHMCTNITYMHSLTCTRRHVQRHLAPPSSSTGPAHTQ